MKIVGLLGKAFDYLEETLIVIGLAFMTCMNFINVVSRYLFTNSFSFTEELTIMAFVWISMLGIAAGYKRYAHLGMSYFVEKFPPKGQSILVLFSMLCSVVTMIIMIKYGVEMVQGQIMLNSRTPALQLPSSMQGLAIPVGGVFIAIRSLQAGITQAIELWHGKKKEDGGIEPIC